MSLVGFAAAEIDKSLLLLSFKKKSCLAVLMFVQGATSGDAG
jgi:hypothetical protein